MTTPGDHHRTTAEISRLLIDTYDQVALIDPITDSEAGFDVPAAYDVLAHLYRDRLARGWIPVGRKIGFTNRTIWKSYGVSGPMWAPMWDRTVQDATGNRATVALASFTQPRIEPEVVFGLRSTPPDTDDAEAILTCVDWMAAGFEIVQCPFPDWKFTAPDCTAAFGLHGALIIGDRIEITDDARRSTAHRLANFDATLSRDGVVVDRGSGANVLDSPALALAYLSRTVAETPQFSPLTAGEIITTGTLTDAGQVAPGDTWTSDYGSLGLTGLTVDFT